MGECINCGGQAKAQGRCDTCYVYWRRTGSDRSEQQVVDANERALHRSLPDAGYVAQLVQRRRTGQ